MREKEAVEKTRELFLFDRDRCGRACLLAELAFLAFRVVNHCDLILHGDCFLGADIHAGFAAHAQFSIYFCRHKIPSKLP
jgi:hypothetical protein